MRSILTAIIILFSVSSFASHIAGGNIEVIYVSPNQYQLKVNLFRSCESGSSGMPVSIIVGVYRYDTDALVSSYIITTPQIFPYVPFGDTCFVPTGLCVDHGIFTSDTITIGNYAPGYYLHTQVYARNASIDNLNGPGSTGMSFYTEMADPAIGPNSSPVLQNYPPGAYFCTGFNRLFTLPITDPDGDSLSYELVDPLQGATAAPTSNGTYPKPYPPVTWAIGYSLANPIGGSVPMSVHASSGIFNSAPDLIGKYVFAAKVSEWRAGVKIGETTIDIQYEAVNCVTCFLVNGAATNASCPTCGDGSIDLVVDTAAIPPLTYNWSSGEFTEDISGLNQGLYYVTVYDANGSNSSRDYYVGGSTALTEYDKWQIKTYPNPAQNLINISLGSEANLNDVQIDIVDINGRLVKTQVISIINGGTSINTSAIPNGNYRLIILTDEHFQSHPVVIMK